MKNFEDILSASRVKRLMVVFPHPDDESMATGGLLLKAKENGWETIVVTLTQGGAGKIHVEGLGGSLKEIRSQELTRAAKILKVDTLVLADFADGRLRQEVAKWKPWLTKIIRKYKPSLVVTYDPSGITGHPDHIILSVHLFKILCRLSPKIALYWVTLPDSLAKRFANRKTLEYSVKPTHVLNLKSDWLKKYFAARAHRSQKLMPAPFLLFTFYSDITMSGTTK